MNVIFFVDWKMKNIFLSSGKKKRGDELQMYKVENMCVNNIIFEALAVKIPSKIHKKIIFFAFFKLKSINLNR